MVYHLYKERQSIWKDCKKDTNSVDIRKNNKREKYKQNKRNYLRFQFLINRNQSTKRNYKSLKTRIIKGKKLKKIKKKKLLLKLNKKMPRLKKKKKRKNITTVTDFIYSHNYICFVIDTINIALLLRYLNNLNNTYQFYFK